MNFKDKVVWITGASTGIGAALAHAFAGEGAKLVLHSRTMEELDEISQYCTERKIDFMPIAFDMAEPNDYADYTKKVTGRFGRIDVLINNVGVSQRALAHETDIAVDRKIFEINYFSAIQVTKAVLPIMLAQGGGSIAATSSISGLFGFPQRSAYAAAKHAVSGFFETVGLELRDRNIYVTIAYPGRIRTAFSLNALRKDGSRWGKMDVAQEKGMPVEKCATRYMNAIRRKKRVVYIGGKEVVLAYIKRFNLWLFYRIAGNVDPNK